MSYYRMREAAKHIMFTYVVQVMCIIGAAFSIYLGRWAVNLGEYLLAIMDLLLFAGSGYMFMKEATARAYWAKVFQQEKAKGPWQ